MNIFPSVGLYLIAFVKICLITNPHHFLSVYTVDEVLPVKSMDIFFSIHQVDSSRISSLINACTSSFSGSKSESKLANLEIYSCPSSNKCIRSQGAFSL